MTVGIIANPHKEGSRRTVEALIAALEDHGLSFALETTAAEMTDRLPGLSGKALAETADVIAVIGGDGTMLHAMAKLGGCPKPMAGINIGNLGFLTSCTDDEIPEFVDALVSGSFSTSERILLDACVETRDGSTKRFLALNEAVLARGQTGRLVALEAKVDGEVLNRYRADGLIVASPTGSTAYSLSAGGPLISPSAGVFVITPICPHTLSQRSLVVSDDVEIELSPEEPSDGPMLFTVDGRDCVEIGPADRVRVRKAGQQLNLLRLEGRSFYAALRQKLNWRGG
ncbi:NAD(+)/NADH kinase [Haloferula sp. A504]|uniref:NAD(+)/NADH kinase n=1 Tax=Haloferula sp. A504 TaxID=3373601 RepID=UPI0031C89313|nr:NAD(+)/NADH kinase [Verrucomicrobiaceae bacterium E54]